MITIPQSSKKDRLKDIAQINRHSLPANTDPDYEFDYLEISNVDYNGIIDKEAIERLRFEDSPSRARRRVFSGNTIISSVRPNLQSVAFIENDLSSLVCSTGFNVVEPLEWKIHPKFAYYVLISEKSRQYFEATAKGVGYPAVDDKDFNSLVIHLPPLPEQKRIAAYLDASCTAIDAAVAVKKRQIETLNHLHDSILLNALTTGLKNSRMFVKTGSDIIHSIPKNWRLTRLKSIATIRYGIGQPPAQLASGIAMIRATDIRAGRISTENFLRLDPKHLPVGRTLYLQPGEIIVVRSGAYTGDSAIVPAGLEDCVAGYDMVVTVNKASPKFIAYCLLSHYVLEGQILLLTLRAAQPHLNAHELGSIVLAIPPKISEQDEIVDFLDTKLCEVESIKSVIALQIKNLIAYRKSLIHECVTGQCRITEKDVEMTQNKRFNHDGQYGKAGFSR